MVTPSDFVFPEASHLMLYGSYLFPFSQTPCEGISDPVL